VSCRCKKEVGNGLVNKAKLRRLRRFEDYRYSDFRWMCFSKAGNLTRQANGDFERREAQKRKYWRYVGGMYWTRQVQCLEVEVRDESLEWEEARVVSCK
jgi:hypothetical protein